MELHCSCACGLLLANKPRSSYTIKSYHPLLMTLKERLRQGQKETERRSSETGKLSDGEREGREKARDCGTSLFTSCNYGNLSPQSQRQLYPLPLPIKTVKILRTVITSSSVSRPAPPSTPTSEQRWEAKYLPTQLSKPWS